MNSHRQILNKFKNKKYRDAFVAENIFSRLPLKIRAMREGRHLSQGRLGELAGVKQEWVSKLENPSYGRLTISTLLKLASAFDCGLFVDFVPFSKVLNDATNLSPESFDVPSFKDDVFVEEPLHRDIQPGPATVTVNVGMTGEVGSWISTQEVLGELNVPHAYPVGESSVFSLAANPYCTSSRLASNWNPVPSPRMLVPIDGMLALNELGVTGTKQEIQGPSSIVDRYNERIQYAS